MDARGSLFIAAALVCKRCTSAANEYKARRLRLIMGNCLECFKQRPESDPIMDREARMRAAEAAAARAQSAANDPLAKRQAAQVKKEKSFGGPTGKPDLADARTWD